LTASVPRTLFVSDLHLADERPAVTRRFLRFLAGEARGAHALYVLGDLFDFWVGDDTAADVLNREVLQAMAALAASGTAVRVMHGNRDFLLAAGFEQASGARLVDDPLLVDLHGVATLLMHGDTLCTDDLAYQAFRRHVRDPAVQRAFLALPVEGRRLQVGQTRARSEQAKQSKDAQIMDVSPATAEAELRRHGHPPRLIHGHTHRPATHEHVVDGRRTERWVLADWHDEDGEYLEVTPARVRRVALAA
jgi:UDP-2,3-diacylglucosamine hydrolase